MNQSLTKKQNQYTASALMLLLSACGKVSATSGSSDPVSLSGSLNAVSNGARVAYENTSSFRSSLRLNEFGSPNASALVNYSSYVIKCVTADVPPVESSGVVKSNGSFSIEIKGGKGKGLNCNILDNTGTVIASLVLKDTSKKDMNGNPQINSSPAFSADASLGTVTLNLTTGDASVLASQVVDRSGRAALLPDVANIAGGAAFDPTGLWKIGDVNFPLPSGVKGTCEPNEDGCNGPPSNAKIYLKRIQGTDIASGNRVYGLQVWQDESNAQDPKGKMEECGEMTGLSAADALKAGVDLSAYGVYNGAFNFATTVTDPNTQALATLSNGYELSTAKAAWTMQACFPVSKTYNSITYNFWVCGADTAGNGSPGGRYQASLGGGCVDANNKAVTNIDWAQVSWLQNCTTESSDLSGFYRSSCNATYRGQAITCHNEFGVFDDDALTIASTPQMNNNPPAFNYSGVGTLISANANCSTGTTALVRANCYVNYYHSVARRLTGCLPRVNTDWSATNVADFAKVDLRPQSLVFMEKLNYTSASSASMLTEQVQNWGVQVQDSSGNTQWVSCGVIDKGGISFVKVSPTRILATYVSATSTTSIDKPACVGASWNGQRQKFLFYLDKI